MTFRNLEEAIAGLKTIDDDYSAHCEAARRIGWGSDVPEGVGRGIAVGIKSGPTTGLSTSIVRLPPVIAAPAASRRVRIN